MKIWFSSFIAIDGKALVPEVKLAQVTVVFVV